MFETFANFFVFEILKLEPSQLASSLEFFVADIAKISFLMLAVIFSISFVRTFLPTDKLAKLFQKSKFGAAYFLAATLGAVTPFCSCSSIPLFIGFLEARAPIGVAFAFLATSPLVNEVVFAVMVGKFGWRIAGIYAASGIILGVIAGILIEKIWGKRPIELTKKGENVFGTQSDLPTIFLEKIKYSTNRAVVIFRKMWWILLIGVAIGAGIHGFVPAKFFLKILGEGSKIWGVPLAVILGVPIYARSASIVPVIFALTVKGLPLGTALALMMSAAGLSLPEAIMLKRIIPLKLLALFFGIVATGIVLIGFGFNLVG